MNPKGNVYFISDLHLGVPTREESLIREKQVVEWLHHIRPDLGELVLLGDVFDFWFEYKHAVPKGYTRLMGALAALTDAGIPVHFFMGNHDMWTFGYLETELGVKVYPHPVKWERWGHRLYLAHGDGLGPGDYSFKIIRKVFRSPFFQWCFARLHPNFGIGLGLALSRRSRKAHAASEQQYLGHDQEWLTQYCTTDLSAEKFDYMVFGHRHLPLWIPISGNGVYVNLGDWVSHFTFGRLSPEGFALMKWQDGQTILVKE